MMCYGVFPETTLSDFYERTRKLVWNLKQKRKTWFLRQYFFKSNQMQTIIGQKSYNGDRDENLGGIQKLLKNLNFNHRRRTSITILFF